MSVSYPWKTKGLVLTAPMLRDVDTVCTFLERYLAGKVNFVVMQTRYRYRFASHPECVGCEPLSEEDVKKLVCACRNAGIRLIPKMNLLGHQSGVHNIPSDGILHGGHGRALTDPDGLLRAYPQFDETPDEEEVYYSRTLCLSHPEVKPVLYDLIDELLDVYEADGIHIGCDEAFAIGQCPRCKGKDPARLYADWVNAIGDHVRARGAELLLWSDRLLDDSAVHFGAYESSANGTHPAIDLVNKKTVLCDWHYGNRSAHEPAYPSVDIFAEKGFEMFLSPWKSPENAAAFIKYAAEHDKGHIRGVLATTWCNSGELARYMMNGDRYYWMNIPAIAETLKTIYDLP